MLSFKRLFMGRECRAWAACGTERSAVGASRIGAALAATLVSLNIIPVAGIVLLLGCGSSQNIATSPT